MKRSNKKRPQQSRKGADTQQSLQKIPDNALVEELQRRAHNPLDDQADMSISFGLFSGPLPPPQTLEEYKSAGANIPDRIVKMAEKEQTHRHGLEEKANNAPHLTERVGQVFALVIVLSFLGGAVFLMDSGKSLSGGALIGGTLFWLAHLFITGRKKDGQKPE